MLRKNHRFRETKRQCWKHLIRPMPCTCLDCSPATIANSNNIMARNTTLHTRNKKLSSV